MPDNSERKDIFRSRDRLPIKLILPKQGRERKVPGGGGPAKPFRSVDTAYRRRLHSQVTAIRDAILPQASKIGSIPIRVRLLSKAVAKSHRPEHLFSRDSCPIIGSGHLGELFLKASPDGLEKLASTIHRNQTDQTIKELSSIESIEPITPVFRRHGVQSIDILKKSPRSEKGFFTRVRLFDFGPDDDQAKLVDDFHAACRRQHLSISQEGYEPSSQIYQVECRSEADVEQLSGIIGIRSITQMPLIRMIRPRVLNARPLPTRLPIAGDVDGDFPVVVVVDSGVTDKNSELQTWIVGRKSDVSPQYRNTDHGTFVAGLICWGSQLNPDLAGIDSNPCGVFDLQVIPNGDPSRGDTDDLIESEFLQSLESALKQYANKYRVWNLSLGSDQVCSLDEFSPLAEQLDHLQEKYRVSFVISAGNYDTLPLLDYPRTLQQLDVGRITSPADSVLGITVGSVSHIDYKAHGPRQHHPSPFSRHGAGPNHIIKPDLIHYGGTCTVDASHTSGIRSVNAKSSAEDLGTSFAAPLISRTLAQIYHQVTPTPSPVLARALLTHHARDPRTGDRVPDGDENFFGFGLPATVPYCLECSPHSSTLIFEDTLRPGYYLEWDDFPYPAALHREGRYYGQVWMTVALAPSRGGRWGTEYCETHIDAHFGVYASKTSRQTGDVSVQFNGLVPPEHKNPGLLYESYQVEKLRKWAPVRTYFGDLGERGKRGLRWRLKVQLLTRHGIEDQEAFKPQPFSLILTIADPLKKAPVYDQMAQTVHNRFQAQNIVVRAASRIRTRT